LRLPWPRSPFARRRRTATDELERLFDLSLDLLCIAGFDGYFKRISPAFERTLGYSSEELLSRPFLEFVHPDDRARTVEAMDVLGDETTVVRFEHRYVRKDGSTCWLEWSARPALDEGLIYAAGRDVSEDKRAEDRLRDAHRTVERSRDELRAVAEEQAALRRVATRVAHGASSAEVFRAVATEIERLLDADTGGLMRYEPNEAVTVLVNHSRGQMPIFALGSHLPLDGDSVSRRVLRSGRPARLDNYDAAPGTIASRSRQSGAHCAVGAPVVVDGRLWGVMIAVWKRPVPIPPDTEDRLGQFAELVATAIANAASRTQLNASRARLVATSDETRRRIERDLHDGTQQRLVSLALGLRAAEDTVPPELPELRADLDRIATGLAGAVEELQEISRGLHPAILSRGGLAPALRTLARRAALPVDISVHANRKLPEQIEVAAYYVISEAITNAAKHSQATGVTVDLHAHDSTVTIAIRDDGIGGADPARGSGLIGLHDRVEAVGGTMDVASTHGQGTSLEVTIPVGGT
jgi:PAS domain S-box-containing protein